MIKKRIKQIKILLADTREYISRKSRKDSPNADKNLLVEFQHPHIYHRFFYLLLEFYKQAGYKIFFPMNFSRFRNLRNGEPYLALIIKEKDLLSINKPPKGLKTSIIRDENFSEDYFKKFIVENNQNDNVYHIPMSFHPLMYLKNMISNEVSLPESRINSVFCYGNFDKKLYSEIDDQPFDIVNRYKLLQFFKSKSGFVSLNNREELVDILKQKKENLFVFAEKEKYSVPMESVLQTLPNFKYFLCCPGVVMPLCHNIVEAMSVGTIPIVQEEYAKLFYPHLKHFENAIIFKDLQDLNNLLDDIFAIPEEKRILMSKNAMDYYNTYLTPDAVVKNIENSIKKNETVYLNAEHRSLILYK